MKQNPFYGLSAAVMLGGCYLVSHALKLEPGHLGKLILLIAVLQIYEALLLGLGVFLISTGRAPRDGLTVLVLETLFLVDAPLLAMECVTADAGSGAFLCLTLLALAGGKLAFVRRHLPDGLPEPVAWLLGLQASLVLLVPVAAAQLAAARVLTPVSLYGLWWLALALPLIQERVLEATRPSGAMEPPFEQRAWTWLPTASVLLHLWAIGWIHQVAFHLAFLAPFALGWAVAARRDQVVRQVLLPALAVVLALGQAGTLGHVLSTPAGAPVSVLKLTLLGAAGTYATLAWRHRFRWLVALAALFGACAVGGPLPIVIDGMGAVVRFIARLVPRSALHWGLAGIVASFVLLAIGARRSLGGTRPPRTRSRRRPPGLSGHDLVTIGVLAGFLSGATALAAFAAHPFGHPRQVSALLQAGTLAMVAVYLGNRARQRVSHSDRGVAVYQVATVVLWAGIGGLVLCAPVVLARDSHRVPRAESAVLADVRAVLAAQEEYRRLNGGFADAQLSCLAEPSGCLPHHDQGGPLLDGALAVLGEKNGYRRSFHPGPKPDDAPPQISATSVDSFAYVAVPADPGYTGVRGFCGDSSGKVCFTTDGSAPPLLDDGTCDPSLCAGLE